MDRTERIVTPDAPKTYLQSKREQIKQTWGERLVCHPGYVTNPRHSFNREIYDEARRGYLRAIAEAAQADRERTPVFLQAGRLREVFC